MVNPHESSSETFTVFLKSFHRSKSLYPCKHPKGKMSLVRQMGTKTRASSSPACTLTSSR